MIRARSRIATSCAPSSTARLAPSHRAPSDCGVRVRRATALIRLHREIAARRIIGSRNRKRMFHVKHPTFAAYPRRSRALPRLRALAPAPPAAPAHLTSHPRFTSPRSRAPHAPSRSRSRPARLACAPPLAGPERLTSRPLPRNPCSRLLNPSCSPVASPFPFVALPMPELSKSKRHQLRFYQHLHSTSTFATQRLSGRLNDRLSTFTQVTGGFSPRNNREGALTRPREASMVIFGELNSLTGINET